MERKGALCVAESSTIDNELYDDARLEWMKPSFLLLVRFSPFERPERKIFLFPTSVFLYACRSNVINPLKKNVIIT